MLTIYESVNRVSSLPLGKKEEKKEESMAIHADHLKQEKREEDSRKNISTRIRRGSKGEKRKRETPLDT